VEQKSELISYIQNISLFLLGIVLMAFPIVFATFTTNSIVLPKQILLGIVAGILLVFQIVRMFAEKSAKFRRTPFDIPVSLLALTAFLSAMFSVNRVDAITAFIPYFISILGFFLIVNIAKDRNALLFLIFSLIIGSVLLSISAILSFFKIYILPFAGTHTQTFTPLGSSLEQGIYLILVFAISSYYLLRMLKIKTKKEGNVVSEKVRMSKQELIRVAIFGVASLIILMGVIVTAYNLAKTDKPLLLPFGTGFQTALSEISLDAGRVTQGFLMGSGYGTYAVDFSRWKLASFNQNADLWSLTFFRSANLPFELLATTGVLGLSAFIFLFIRIVKELRASSQNKIHFAIIIMLLISLLLPLNFASQTLFFIILGLYAVNQGILNRAQNRFFDIELQLVTFRKGLIAMEAPHSKNEKSLILPSAVGVIILTIVGLIGYYSIPYITSDITFQKSLVATVQNNGKLTYQLQREAISAFPYRDGFYRVFSQTNLALANTLAAQQPKGATVDQTTQQTITQLIQQSIDSGRSAVTMAPLTNLNWQNLSSIYRGLIGFGQNAESFAVATAQQSALLDPNNPQQYITLGGIYYQLQQWDNAQAQFQTAITLKTDYANSYYNLGHVLEQKNDLQNALAQYQVVRSLVANDKASLDQIDKEIAALQGKAQAVNQTADTNEAQQQPLSVDKPETQLPAQNPPVKIPAPPTASEAAK
jgi:Flp pilus assembly protein TadD